MTSRIDVTCTYIDHISIPQSRMTGFSMDLARPRSHVLQDPILEDDP
jgi:hypothetical protein